MKLWLQWWRIVQQLRPACSRSRTFLWMGASLAAMTARGDLSGVTSLVRALGLKKACYERILGLFHSTALDLDKLTRLWVTVIQNVLPGILRINGRRVIVGDGIKVPKSGKKMPAVKRLHQQSDSNTKPGYIMGLPVRRLPFWPAHSTRPLLFRWPQGYTRGCYSTTTTNARCSTKWCC